MCGFVGFCNLDKKITNEVHNLKDMTNTLTKRGPDEGNYFIDENIALGHRRLIIIDAENGKQPMSAKIDDTTYTIVYNGQLYNAKDLREELISYGYEFNRIL